MSVKTISNMFSFVVGVPAFIWLIQLAGWKIALAVFLMMWANNAMLTARETER